MAAKMPADPSTNLGRRAGVICSSFGACDPMMGTSSCQLSVKAPDQTVLKGTLSMCTIEGINIGRLPSMAFVPPGELLAFGRCWTWP
jgi:hypothetical protein